jgi:arginyl-tRNA synthetase
MALTETLDNTLRAAIAAAFDGQAGDADPVLRRAKANIGADYQANGAFALAKQLRRAPAEIANAIVGALDTNGIIESADVGGNGFINLHLRNDALAGMLETTRTDERLGVPEAPTAETVVIDYSGPNAAKELHVGHLRSTVIGDSLARLLTFAGHDVIRQNHLGDWGTQFGMLLEYLIEERKGDDADVTISDLDALYRSANQRFTSDEEFANRARRRVVALQSGDPQTLEWWHRLIDESKRHLDRVYRRLSVLLTDDDYRGESFYNPTLPDVCEFLIDKGLAIEEQGALCAFPPGFTGREGRPLPIILRKSDGGYGYEATDVAALRFRVEELGATWIVYVVDQRQAQRLAMVFELGRMAGWLDEKHRAEHVGFGLVLGDDGKPLKTRSGENVKLSELLDEAEQRAAAVLAERDFDDDQRAALAEDVGIGAIKYGDLVNDRMSDYHFDWDRLIRFDGDTAPYLQYAVARIRSIFRKTDETADDATISLASEPERQLALALLTFPDAVDLAVRELQPHKICGYLFELASTFTTFYEACPVLKAPDDATRRSRLALCALTKSVLECGLGLLGIAVPPRM